MKDNSALIGCLILLGIGGFIVLVFEYPFIALLLILIVVILGIILVKKDSPKLEIEREKLATEYQKRNVIEMEFANSIYPALLKKYGVDTKKCVTRKDTDKRNYIWATNDSLKMFPVLDQTDGQAGWDIDKYMSAGYSAISISFDNIEYFEISGETYHETKISGGGGGGSDIGGAIIGGLIAGATGAVVGSRKEVEPIKSEMIFHDDRAVILCYSKKGKRKTLMFSYDDIHTFNDLIPEKSYSVVFEINKRRLINEAEKVNESNSITMQIKDLAKLKEDGILTEEEFTNKKKDLLARM